MKPLTTTEITKYLRNNLPPTTVFLGVVSADHWPKELPEHKCCCFISNTQSSLFSGQHWIACFLDSKKKASYFDSYARRLPYPQWKAWFKKHSIQVKLFRKQIQRYGTHACGYFCIYYLLHKSKRPHLSDSTLMNNVSGIQAYNFVKFMLNKVI